MIYFVLSSHAQESIYKRTDAIHSDFQKYADTTFILKKEDSGLVKPSYFILSKKDTLINIYYYGDATQGLKIPLGIKLAMKRENFKENKVRALENTLFYPIPLAKVEALDFWRKIMLVKPWEINDDIQNQYCPDPKIKLFDGTQITLFMVTKTEIKSVSFPSPDFYEEKCPSNKHRKAILKVQELFKTNFRF